MKRVQLNAYQIGLVFKNGAYQSVLKEGTHWLWSNQSVFVYNLLESFVAPVAIEILLQDQELAELMEVIVVKEGELVLQLQRGLLQAVLGSGVYTYWKSIVDREFIYVSTETIEIEASVGRQYYQHKLLSPYIRTFSIESYEKGVMLVDGVYLQTLGAGTYYWWKNAQSISIAKADIRSRQLEINGQEILTRDKATIRINAAAQYRISNIEKALLENKEYEKQLYMGLQLALRELVASMNLDELLAKRESISLMQLSALASLAEQLGLEVVSFGIRDIILPGDMKEIMNQVLVAEKKAQAIGIMRREETASTRSLLNTAKLMEENSMLLKLKEMEYVEKIADKIGNIQLNGTGLISDQLKQLFVKQ